VDNVVILGRSGYIKKTEQMVAITQQKDLQMNDNKTKYMLNRQVGNKEMEIELMGKKYEKVESFRYLGATNNQYKAPDIVNVIKIQRMEWLGHGVRMNETRSVKKIFEGKLEGRRGRRRSRLRWINDVEDDLRELGVKRWRTKASEREEWASIIKEAKAKLKGP
jgi:hypothetical protein